MGMSKSNPVKSPVTLISAAGFMLGGAFSYNKSLAGSAVLGTAGLILLGVWITIEVWSHKNADLEMRYKEDG
jgi:hypothetical protein